MVTGAAGFIGSHLVEELLRQGCQVFGVDSLTDYYARELKLANLSAVRDRPGFTFLEERLETLGSEELPRRIDFVFHLAAQAGVRPSWGSDFETYLRCNLLATQHLLELLRERAIEAFIYASSSSVYGRQPSGPMREDATLWPVSPYGVTKAATEQLARAYGTVFGIPTVGLRYFTVYGPRQRPDMAFHRLLHALAEEGPFPLYGDGGQKRDFTFVADAVAGTLAAAQGGQAGAVYNIGGGSSVSLLQVLGLGAEIAGRQVQLHRDQPAAGEMRETMADIGKARSELGYVPKTKLRDGLSAHYRWVCDRLAATAGVR